LRKALAVLTLCVATAGCWQSKGSLYGDAPSADPLRTGKVASTSPDDPKDVSHAVITRDKNGAYRLTNADKGTADFGDAFVVRFFALAGLPKGQFVFEAVADDRCEPGKACNRMTAASDRYYGLMRLTKTGAEISNPDCGKDSAVARLSGVSVGDYATCTFTSRASLEAALTAQAAQPFKVNLTYRYE
jgi:hypothetical protein